MEKMTLIWLDLEMTGLDVDKDHIMEAALIVTDFHLNVLERKDFGALKVDPLVLNSMDKWNTDTHGQSGLTDRCRLSDYTVHDFSKEFLGILAKYPGKLIIAGNSIYNDVKFLNRWCPETLKPLSHQLYDVTTLKLEAKGRYVSVADSLKKTSDHTAMKDIENSINELRHYRKGMML